MQIVYIVELFGPQGGLVVTLLRKRLALEIELLTF